MKHVLLPLAALSLIAAAPAPAPKATPAPPPTPGEIVARAPASDWVTIAPADLLVMDLAPLPNGKPRRVVIQLIPAPFSQGWVNNIRKLAAAHWWDGSAAIVRVQDNYVTQWGDTAEYDKRPPKALPPGLATVPESEYTAPNLFIRLDGNRATWRTDQYATFNEFAKGWPVASDGKREWPVHCYGMVGVGRNLSPDTGTGAELYTVIGHAPRHLDRNIALVGRIISGMEFMSSLPRGTGALGFYETAAERTPILSVRLASELPAADQPHFQYLSTDSASFAAYAKARANRHDAFFITPAGGADICNVPVPIRKAP